jgi:glutathione S-transferase
MRLFTSRLAPNSLRVIMLFREKKLGIPLVVVDLNAPPQKKAHRAINPFAQVTALELDDGTYLAESLTISQYLDAVSGPPYLFGESLEQRMQIAMWERRAELSLFISAIEYGHHTHPMFHTAPYRFPDWAQSQLPQLNTFYVLMGERLDSFSFLAGNEFSAADVTAYIGMSVAEFFGIQTPAFAVLHEWKQRIAARSSAKNSFQGS